MKATIPILFLSLAFIANGQQPLPARSLNPAAESGVQAVIKNLELDNTLRFSLEKGDRGDGIHHAWMDKMRQYGVRQASFTIGFKWKDGIESLKIKDVSFLRQYYRYETRIKDLNLLRQIRDAGLEQELRTAILVRVTKAVSNMMEGVNRTAKVRPRRARGTLYLNLLDDEALPILNETPNVEW